MLKLNEPPTGTGSTDRTSPFGFDAREWFSVFNLQMSKEKVYNFRVNLQRAILI